MSVRLSLIQMRHRDNVGGNVDAAVDRIKRVVAEAGADADAAGEGHIVCLPELFAGEYPCQSEDHRQFDLAEPIPGPTTDRLSRLAAELSVVIVVPVFERRAPGLYHNAAAVIDADGSIAGISRKMHVPDDPLYYEKFYFTPGDAAAGDAAVGEEHSGCCTGGFNVIATRYAKLGVGICWDQWFPEAARLWALGGAEILLYPSAIGWVDSDKADSGAATLEAWQITLRSHAVANGLFVAAANRVGVEGRLEFWGRSMVVGPHGQVMAEAADCEESVVTAELELEAIDLTRRVWPFLRDRRVDAYGGLGKRWIE